MLQLRNRVPTAACPLPVNSAVSVRTIRSVDDVTVAFRCICSKVTATNAGRVDGSIPTTCDALPSVILFEKPYGRDSRKTSTSQSLFGTTPSTSSRPTTTRCDHTCKLTRFKSTLYKLKFKYQNPLIMYVALCCACLEL